MRGSSPTSSTILTRAWEQRAHTKCSTCGHPFTCSPRDPRVPPRARWTDLQESFLRLKTTVLPMTKNAKPVGVMNGGDSGTFGQRCRRVRGETNPRRRVAIVDQAAQLIGFHTRGIRDGRRLRLARSVCDAPGFLREPT